MLLKSAFFSIGLSCLLLNCNHSTNSEEISRSDEESVKAFGDVLVKRALEIPGVQISDPMAMAKENLKSIGACQGLIDFLDDISDFSIGKGNPQEFVGKAKSIGECFAGGPIADLKDMGGDEFMKSLGDPKKMDECICGSGGGSIFGIYADVAYAYYESPTSSAGAEYKAPSSSAGAEYKSPESSAGAEYKTPESSAGATYESPK